MKGSRALKWIEGTVSEVEILFPAGALVNDLMKRTG